ncbi:unnamed protein product [Effrenium voratum]|uniref:Uncharacterized protein n=1 Tax=Effrenium voratum TaxID=2562239 RepID=A0AA36INN8_9DINO|nr:unnamed protein product [Effrenium voratum]CAJ1453818.1 unnamed protein product [Effrenium voratum]
MACSGGRSRRPKLTSARRPLASTSGRSRRRSRRTPCIPGSTCFRSICASAHGPGSQRPTFQRHLRRLGRSSSKGPRQAADQAASHQQCGPVSMYVAGVQAYVGYKFQWWPFLTYTCWSYALLNLHLLLHAVQLPRSAEILRFPVLAMATVTTFVWWLVLVPILVSLTEGKSRKEFIKLNFSFFLVNMHLFNFPLALAGHLLAPRKLVFADFWVAAVIAILYLLFYLLALDPRGVHLYIILTPRQWWCVLCYSGILGLYVGLFWIFS